jgi:glutamate carboxypeptidase
LENRSSPRSFEAMPIDPSALELPRKAELRDRLFAWCEINSGSDHPAGLGRMLAALRDAFRDLPGRMENVALGTGQPLAFRVVCRPEAPVQVLLNAHFDTVYSAAHPFQRCEIVDADRLRGPGVADCKGGILVILTALRAFEALPGEKQLGWEVLLGPDEEIGSHGTAPVYAETAQHHDFALVFEPARENGDLVRARKATGTFVAACHGRAAHAARASAGHNAILALAEFLLAAARVPESLPDVSINVGNIRGGGAANVVPDFATAEIDARISRAADAVRVESRLRELAAPLNAREGFRLELTGGFTRSPMEATPATQPLFAAWQACGRMLELQFDWQSVGGASDGNLLAAAGLPVLDGLGPVGGELHSDREWIRVSSLVERAHLAALFLARVNAGEIAPPARVQPRREQRP